MKIIKTDGGYTLRQSPFPLISGITLLSVGLFLGLILLAFLPVAQSTKEKCGMAACGLMVLILLGAGLYLLIDNIGRHLVLDQNGVHLRRTLMKETVIPWEKVRDFGITHQDGTYRHRNQRAHYFYISPSPLYSDGRVRVIRPKNRALSLMVSRDEIDELYAVGILDFCEKQINEEREEWDTVKPYSSLNPPRS